MTKKNVSRELLDFLLRIVRSIETENLALRQMLQESGRPDEALQEELNRRTGDVQLQKQVDDTIAPAFEEMTNILGRDEARAILERWKPKGRPN